MFEYRVIEVLKVYDGDTITVRLDLGFGISKKDNIRFARINAPEIRGEERPQGLISRDWLRERISKAVQENKILIIKTEKDRKGKYGRYIGELYIDGVCVNDELVSESLAEYVNY